jgi:hypothetical protein
MDNQERIRHNASENGISVERQRVVEKYMAMKINEWPPRLTEIAKDLCQETGFCGETLVAACVKYQAEGGN